MLCDGMVQMVVFGCPAVESGWRIRLEGRKWREDDVLRPASVLFIPPSAIHPPSPLHLSMLRYFPSSLLKCKQGKRARSNHLNLSTIGPSHRRVAIFLPHYHRSVVLTPKIY
eukprot:scaffold15872_cov145-Skeletonema_menzelii.AAC.4